MKILIWLHYHEVSKELEGDTECGHWQYTSLEIAGILMSETYI